ncbi:DUF4097 family beta strand repeat-containing protein [Streptomyces sp. SAJ15]|uniref:DUF4097 family beta strand repeat-containing protein n=1 Tax=Streptomyces sp. SAJ15 TaxID=2011095 RepID=UPI001185A44B|nr:DUF4097 family beta strand repeat-containing protein [Streptomyces sp. SAJ15]TVL94088.1 hypothetical protein CD790_03560 [Streptomyces sp. SAJ15]
MSARSEWSIEEPRRLTFDEPASALQVWIVGGTVNVVGTDDGPARLEVSEIEGPPLAVTHQDGTLSVGYDDLPWKSPLKWLDRREWTRTAHLTLAVPSGTAVSIGVVGADVVLSGLSGRAELRGVSGDLTLVGLAGEVSAQTVSGRVEAQSVTGELRFHSVSGDLTVVEGAAVHADSVSGNMVLDLAPHRAARGTDLRLTTVSGEIAVRLPRPADARVDATTTSGAVSCAFEDLRVSGEWGAKRITGTLGSGRGSLRATSVSGAIALLRRPDAPTSPEGKPL